MQESRVRNGSAKRVGRPSKGPRAARTVRLPPDLLRRLDLLATVRNEDFSDLLGTVLAEWLSKQPEARDLDRLLAAAPAPKRPRRREGAK